MEELGVLPSNRKTTILPSEGCPTLHFSFSAEDPDINDTLTVRWYVDYPASSAIEPEQRLAINGQAIRDDKGSLDVDLSNHALAIPASFLQQPGTHVVEALLFDFALGELRRPVPFDPATDGGIPNPSYVVSYAWVVEASHACPLP